MSQYTSDKHFTGITYLREQLNFHEFESCTFTECDFSACLCAGLTLIDCTFVDCNFNSTAIAHSSLRTVRFEKCAISDVNFSMCDRLIFEVHFIDCRLDFSKFYSLKLNASSFTGCSLIAVDFMSANLSGIVFDNCDLYRAVFEKANLTRADLSMSCNFTIDPQKTTIKKAKFSLQNVGGLLHKHGLDIS